MLLVVIIFIILGLLVIDYVFIKKFFTNSNIKNTLYKISTKKKFKFNPGHGQGIVIPVTPNDIPNLLLLINTLPPDHYPITITFTEELYLPRIGNVSLLKIPDICDKQLSIHSLINSPYEETILLQPNVLFLSPELNLFNFDIYKQTGTLFWKDPISEETIHTKKIVESIKELVPYEINDNPITSRKSASFQAEGVVVFDKSNHYKTLKILSIMMEENINDLIPIKELYWLACELAQEPYGFNPGLPGMIGEKNEITGMICGYNLYSPLLSALGPALLSVAWWQGGIIDGNDKVINFSHYTGEGSADIKYNNLAAFFSYGTCASGFNILELPFEIKNIINNYIYIFHNLRNKFPDIF